ncbi:MAG: N-6 DNA methylase [Deltaproteobacteria bacterium]|nr:N-6 DNA methylase [Deltaproteobacteria bacterium]
MLDTETKRRIDSARDILVGKVPDPKSQVEQITIALIYKFMDDMDLESEELGGERSFFKGEYEKYAWRKIFDPRLGGFEILNLYSEAIMKMNVNPNIPQLFRDIFKNAYLPYRDPETLKAFLKVINDFNYDHSERLGDAFEYLLAVLGSQGEAGQFRTPRHIIDFMVEIIVPKKDETILDPACGTAGFLISSYKHIIKHNSSNYTPEEETKTFEVEDVHIDEITINSKKYSGDKLTPDERSRLAKNITGYDISPDMVRLSLVNMYLHGLHSPLIHEYDTLTNEDKWNEYADVMLANPPFMSPKGGIRPHKRFSITSKRSEVLFVDYIAEHLTPNGRAAVIVPEGIIFKSDTAYKKLRKMLVRNYLVGVISLPAGVFNPYSGVKTSILWLDKALAKKTERVLFVKIENDGFELGAQRNPIKQNDLPDALNVINSFRRIVKEDQDHDHKSNSFLLVDREKIIENTDVSLSQERYRETDLKWQSSYKFVDIGSICSFEYGKPLKKDDRKDGEYPVYGSNGVVGYHDSYLVEAPYLVIGRKGTAGAVHYSSKNGYPIDTTFYVKLESEEKVLIKYLYHILSSADLDKVNVQSGIPGLNRNDAYRIKIPLPPLSVQEEIVAEIESYQKIIDGARQVVENYKPRIDFDPEWPMVELGEVCVLKGGKRLPKGEIFSDTQTLYPYIRVADFREMSVNVKNLKYISQSIHNQISRYIINMEDVYISIAGTIGLFGTIPEELNGANLTENAAKLIIDKTKLDKFYLTYLGNSQFVQEQIKKLTHAVGVPKLALERIKTIKIPLPPIDFQKFEVKKIKNELDVINRNKILIENFEQKIKDRIAKVWGE